MIEITPVDTHLHVPSNSRFGSGTVQGEQPATQAAIFLDRDGVVVEDVHYLRDPAQLYILPGVVEALRALQDLFYVVVVTNQSGIARGFLTEDDLIGIHSELVRSLAVEGAMLDALYYCPHLPKGAAVEAYQAECYCRKPKPGMLLQAKRDSDIDMSNSFMVGDSPRDIKAGRSAGVTGILIGNERENPDRAQASIADLSEAARLILSRIDT